MESWTEWTVMKFKGLDLNRLKVDEAYIYATNHDANNTYYLYWKTIDCMKCPFKKLSEIAAKYIEIIPKPLIPGFGPPKLIAKDEEDGPSNGPPTDGKPPEMFYWDNGPNISAFPVYTAKDLELRLTVQDYGSYFLDNYINDTVPAEQQVWKLGLSKLGQFGVYNLTIGRFTNNSIGMLEPCEGKELPTLDDGTVLDGGTQWIPGELPFNDTAEIFWNVEKDPVNIYTSFILIALILIAFYWICKGLHKVYRIWRESGNRRNEASQAEDPETLVKSSGESLPEDRRHRKTFEIFRGMAILLMIFVNSPHGGGRYWWVLPATWNGIHVSDFVLPALCFILGTFIAFSIDAQLKRKLRTETIVIKIIKRSVSLFIIGIFVNTAVTGATFERLRISGILQRIAFVGFFLSLMHFILYQQHVPREKRREGSFEKMLRILHKSFADFVVLFKEYIVMFFIIVAYCIVLFGFEVPDCGHGYFGPGGIHEYPKYKSCTGGVTGLIDRYVLGKSHLMQNSSVETVYDSLPFDPENILGVLPAIFQGFLGIHAGCIFLIYKNFLSRIIRWILWGVLMAGLTILMTMFSWDDAFIPINRNLFSLSMVTATSAVFFLLITVIYVLVELLRVFRDFWKIFLYPGRNPLFLMVAHRIFQEMWPFTFGFNVMNTHFILLFQSCFVTIVWILISFFMEHKKYYISV